MLSESIRSKKNDVARQLKVLLFSICQAQSSLVIWVTATVQNIVFMNGLILSFLYILGVNPGGPQCRITSDNLALHWDVMNSRGYGYRLGFSMFTQWMYLCKPWPRHEWGMYAMKGITGDLDKQGICLPWDIRHYCCRSRYMIFAEVSMDLIRGVCVVGDKCSHTHTDFCSFWSRGAVQEMISTHLEVLT